MEMLSGQLTYPEDVWLCLAEGLEQGLEEGGVLLDHGPHSVEVLLLQQKRQRICAATKKAPLHQDHSIAQPTQHNILLAR